MVEILRDQTRQYAVDKRDAIGLQNAAATMGDVAQTANAAGKIIDYGNAIRAELAQPEEEEAQKGIDRASAELDAFNTKRAGEGAVLDSPEYEKELRAKAAEIYKTHQPEMKWSSAQKLYGKGADKYTEALVNQNIRNAARQRVAKAQEAARQRASAAAQDAQGLSSDYVRNAAFAGQFGRFEDMEGLTNEYEKSFDKISSDIALPIDRDRAKYNKIKEATEANIAGSLSSGNQNLIASTDYALNDNEAFKRKVPSTLLSLNEELEKNDQLAEWKNKRDAKASDLATASGAYAKELNNQIKLLDYQISELENNNVYVTGGDNFVGNFKKLKREDFGDIAVTKLRESIKNTAQPLADKFMGERALANRQQMQQAHREGVALGISDPLDPNVADKMRIMAEQSEKEPENMTPIKRNADGTYSAVEKPQMSYEGGEKPKTIERQMYESYVGYRDAMSQVSQIEKSSYETKAEVNRALYELSQIPVRNEMGDSRDFEFAAFQFLQTMANSPLTEPERRQYADTVAKMMLAQDDELQELRNNLASGDVGIYDKKTSDTPFFGAVATEAGKFLYGGRTHLKDMRGGEEMLPIPGSGKKAYYTENKGFDRAMLHAQAEYQTGAVNMWANGASKEDIAKYRKEVFDKAINQYYQDRHIVDLKVLDDKLENHQEAFAEINGVTYQYKGRDSIGRPIWKDTRVLNFQRSIRDFIHPRKIEQD